MRMEALKTASILDLPDWCLAAGFVRNLVLDKLHGYEQLTPLNDIDLLYFEPADTCELKEREYENRLKSLLDLPWSVKNQARMHVRNNDEPYSSTSDAMSYWVEVETAIGVRLSPNKKLELVAPFGLKNLLSKSITLNLKRPKPDEFKRRICDKKWLETWPQLKVFS